ncbi:MAG: PhoPQ-activated protein PqaA family protein, partial [Candidatus Hydrogenedentes bacterium]|nr:PhoPQ-activated protein PqaA family protein [Candidatus Hydrogenedentota bacterium]
MKRNRIPLVAFFFTCFVTGLAVAGPLADYVNSPDSNYAYQVTGSYDGDRYTTHFVRMTSQSWREGDVTPHIWKHWLSIHVPEDLRHTEVLLRIQGGKYTDDQPGPEHQWATI